MIIEASQGWYSHKEVYAASNLLLLFGCRLPRALNALTALASRAEKVQMCVDNGPSY
jgi:hypothetical protein